MEIFTPFHLFTFGHFLKFQLPVIPLTDARRTTISVLAYKLYPRLPDIVYRKDVLSKIAHLQNNLVPLIRQ